MNELDKIIIINLDERTDRWFFCKNQIKNYGLNNVQRFSAVKNNEGFIGCMLSHIKALELLLKENEDSNFDKTYLILEDDFFFSDSRENIEHNLKPLFYEYQDIWDVFLLSRTYEQYDKIRVNNYYKLKKSNSTCGYIMKSYMVPIILENFKNNLLVNRLPIDVSWYPLFIRYNFFTTKVPIIKQLNSLSAIENKTFTYQEHEFIEIHIKGNLGNILFQIAYGIQLGLRYQKFIYFQNSKFLEIYNSGYNLFKNFDIVNKHKSINNKIIYNDIPFKEIKLEKGKNYYVEGYFQSYKYFESVIPEGTTFMDLLHFSNKTIESVISFLNEYKKYNYEIVAVHVQRGNYTNLTETFIDLCSTNYYENAFAAMKQKCLGKKIKFLIFSNDISFVEKHDLFKNNEIIRSDDPIFSFLLMTFCDHYIIANSSYSWWNAYLSRNKDNKIVFYPDKYYVSVESCYDTSDLYPKHWIPIISSNVTLTMIYFPLKKSKHNRKIYENVWIPNMMKIKNPIVIYTTNEMFSYFKKLRSHYMFGTQIIIMKLKDLYAYKYYFNPRLDPQREIHVPELYYIWNSKQFLLYRTSQENPFQSKYFMYIDIGSMRNVKHNNYCDFPNLQKFEPYLNQNKIILYKIDNLDIVAGGYIFGVKEAIENFNIMYYNEVDNKKTNYFKGREENVLKYIASENPNQFKIIGSNSLDKSLHEDEWFKLIWYLTLKKNTKQELPNQENSNEKLSNTFVKNLILVIIFTSFLIVLFLLVKIA